MAGQGGQGTGAVKLYITVDGADRLSDEFKAARREIRRQNKRYLLEAVNEEVTPYVLANMTKKTGRFANSVYVRATQKDAYFASRLRGKDNRAFGLREFGGTVGKPGDRLRGKMRKVTGGHAANGQFTAATKCRGMLKLPDGNFRSSVSKYRVVKPSNEIRSAIIGRRKQVSDAYVRKILDSMPH